MTDKAVAQEYEIYACLPFVALDKETSIKLGPVVFWAASKYKEFVSPENQNIFHSYIQSIGQIKAKIAQEQATYVNTSKVDPEDATCISIDSSIPFENRKALLIDSLHLLYFACTFRNLYYSNEIPSFNAFRKLIPADMPFIQSSENWQDLFIKENYREESVCLLIVDSEIFEGFGKLLYAIYDPAQNFSKEDRETFERVVRSICYLVDRFFPRFVNLVEKGLSFSDKLYEPEDIIFLAASFEALLNINEDQRNSDFKQKVRVMLNFRYSNPLELFWKWVDDFYEIRKKIIKGGYIPHTQFKLNPNIEVPHLLIGIKIFIYAIFYTLYQYKLISKIPDELDVSHIPVDEILIFFWTEDSLLKKIERSLTQIKKEPGNQELLKEIEYLTNLYLFMQEKFLQAPHSGIHYSPSPQKDIELDMRSILNHIKENASLTLPENFEKSLQARLVPMPLR